MLAPQGKVDGWGRITRVADDGFEVLVDAGAGEAWEARLRRFLLRTKADITGAKFANNPAKIESAGQFLLHSYCSLHLCGFLSIL